MLAQTIYFSPFGIIKEKSSKHKQTKQVYKHGVHAPPKYMACTQTNIQIYYKYIVCPRSIRNAHTNTQTQAIIWITGQQIYNQLPSQTNTQTHSNELKEISLYIYT